MKQLKIALFFSIWCLVACSNSNNENINKNKATSTDSLTKKVGANNEPIVYDTAEFPANGSFLVRALTTGTFHSDEVWMNADKEKWFGIFQNTTGFYITSTQLKIKRVRDEMFDESKNVKTGWEVKTTNKDTCIFLVESFPALSNRSIQSVPLPKKQIYPGDTVKFQYLGIDYQLFATGGKKQNQDALNAVEVWNYKLYLSATIKGQLHKSLLAAQPNFNDKMISVIFAGDIDGDGIVDLLIDNSNHYNATSPTLYLSKPAEKGEVLKPIGNHLTVGC